ncbi:CPBP family glutamic-type intramembrane protease [Treponema pedis]|uniref:CPBP family glutamic-type intramembrane protease n=1 Tax=Treponema pedis TaxID=409322 RepID=UPI003142534F
MKQKIQTLKWYDILALTVIFFGYAIYTSTLYFIQLIVQNTAEIMAPPQISVWQNYQSLITQLVLLAAALAYLKFRNFDFSQWSVRFSFKAVLGGIAIFIILALCMDIYYLLISPLLNNVDSAVAAQEVQTAQTTPVFDLHAKIILIIYAMLNGTYEELFFLGICLAVPPKHTLKAFIFSLLVRFGFHTYMGAYTALGLSLICGTIYFTCYSKLNKKNLLPYFISHAFADVFGLGLYYYFYYLYYYFH